MEIFTANDTKVAGKIRHLGSLPEDSGSRYKNPAFSLK